MEDTRLQKKSIDILQEKIIPKSNIYCEPRLINGLYKKFDIEKKETQQEIILIYDLL